MDAGNRISSRIVDDTSKRRTVLPPIVCRLAEGQWEQNKGNGSPEQDETDDVQLFYEVPDPRFEGHLLLYRDQT